MDELNLKMSISKLPTPAKGVENHLSWIEDDWIAEGIMKCSIGPHENMKTYVTSLLEESPMELLDEHLSESDKREDDEEEDSVRRRPTTFGILAHNLNLASMNAYVGNSKEAKKYLNRTINLLTDEFADKTTSGQSLAISYIIDSLDWCFEEINKTSGYDDLLENMGKLTVDDNSKDKKATNAAASDSDSKVAKFGGIWEALQNDPQAKALLQFFRGNLAATMKVSLFQVLEKFQLAAELHPKYFVYHHYCYRMLRRIRRNITRQNEGGRLRNPSDKERAACEMAYQLATEDVDCIVDMALLIKESLWVQDDTVWASHESEYLHCVELLRKATKIATETDAKSLICKTKMYLGDLLVFGKGYLLNQLEGKLLFEECEQDNPNSSMVLHKLAKMYNYGAFSSEKFKDPELAKQYYKRALAAGNNNYACLMEYIKFLNTCSVKEAFPLLRSRCYIAMLDAIDSALKTIKFDHQVANLLIARGLIMWLFNPRRSEVAKQEACKVWIGVMKDFPEFAKKLCWDIKKPPFFYSQGKRANIKFLEVVRELKKLKSEAEDEKDVATSTVIGKLISKILKG